MIDVSFGWELRDLLSGETSTAGKDVHELQTIERESEVWGYDLLAAVGMLVRSTQQPGSGLRQTRTCAKAVS